MIRVRVGGPAAAEQPLDGELVLVHLRSTVHHEPKLVPIGSDHEHLRALGKRAQIEEGARSPGIVHVRGQDG